MGIAIAPGRLLGRRFNASQASWQALLLRDVMKSFVTPAWRRLGMIVRERVSDGQRTKQYGVEVVEGLESNLPGCCV